MAIPNGMFTIEISTEAKTPIAKAVDLFWLLDEIMERELTKAEYLVYLRTCGVMVEQQLRHKTSFIVSPDLLGASRANVGKTVSELLNLTDEQIISE